MKTTLHPQPAFHGNGRQGFTLVELLVVILILSILVGLVVSVGRYVADEAARKNTVASQAIIMQAINAFYTSTNTYPGDTTWVADLKGNADAAKVLSSLPKSAVGSPGSATPQFLDGWGRTMTYSSTQGMGGRPVIISNGPDGVAGNTDDVRSDK